tara:strand:+ start:4256 stop:5071 length:816 start_codon:yes stop_codon:yes gene_type:complete
MKKDVSIILPSIRPQNLYKFYRSAEKACRERTFEIVIASPYELPKELEEFDNIKLFKTKMAPTAAKQAAVLLSNADYLYNTTDDGLIQEDCIDLACNTIECKASKFDIVNMIYNEGCLDPDTLKFIPDSSTHHPPEYWDVNYHGDLRLPLINQNWKLCMHFFMRLNVFYELGGFDCEWEYSNHALHDLVFRLQHLGGTVSNLSETAFLCSHLPEKTGDHGPVHDAQIGPDSIKFYNIYANLENKIEDRIYLDYNNWKKCPNVWERRFGNKT